LEQVIHTNSKNRFPRHEENAHWKGRGRNFVPQGRFLGVTPTGCAGETKKRAGEGTSRTAESAKPAGEVVSGPQISQSKSWRKLRFEQGEKVMRENIKKTVEDQHYK